MTRQRIVPTLLMLASLGVLVVVVVQGYQNAAFQRCQTKTNDALVRAQQARGDAAEKRYAADDLSVTAEDDLWNAVNRNQTLPPAQAKAESEKAFKVYLERRAEAQKMREDAAADRKAHPLPDPPSERCG